MDLKEKVISIYISIGTYRSFLNKIIEFARNNTSSYVCVANVHMVIEAYDDKNFAEVVNNADLVTPDGMPLVKSLNYLYGIKQDRVAGMDLLPDLLKLSTEKQISVFFYGGSEILMRTTKWFLEKTYPELIVGGIYSPPFRELSLWEENEVVKRINESKANIVFVVLGCPRQEKWMAKMKGRINACMIGIGGALPVMVGLQRRAPKWMQNASLEWLYRFYKEPIRLFKRYAYTNSCFIYLLCRKIIINIVKKIK